MAPNCATHHKEDSVRFPSSMFKLSCSKLNPFQKLGGMKYINKTIFHNEHISLSDFINLIWKRGKAPSLWLYDSNSWILIRYSHRVKSVCIRSFSGRYFSTFGLNTEGYSVSFRIQSECVKIRTRKTPNTDTCRQCLGSRVPYLNS